MRHVGARCVIQMTEMLDVNGEQPNLNGFPCEAMIAEEHWHDGQLCDPANVAWLRFCRTWHRLHFYCGIIFWRTSETGPEAYVTAELGGEVRLVDLGTERGLVGDELASCDAGLITGGSEVRLVFRSGKSITFQNVDDVTSYTG